MTIRVALHHVTRYRYDRLVTLSPHVIRLRPAVHSRTPIRAYSLRVTPENHFINWQQDPFGNHLARLVFNEPTRELSIEVGVVADLTVINPFDFFVEESAEKFPFTYEARLRKDLAPYLEVRESGPLLRQYLDEVSRAPRNINDFLVDLNQRLWRRIRYSIRLEPGVQSCETTLDKSSGSCRDSAWLLTQILRHLGLAARFVSGYLVQLTADIPSLDGPSGPSADFTDLHAWTEVYVPGAGWIGLDPTSGLFAGEGHIPLACAPDPESAAPVEGCTDLCEVAFEYTNEVNRIHEDPRVTKPYSEDQWATIEALGRAIDVDLQAHDVRLTMGGEPTFVSIDDMDGAEWNIAALGEDKRRKADDLARRLQTVFAPGGMLHFGQGKWYPGEPLPRWRLGCHWRTDGVPVWRDPWLIADGVSGYGHGFREAERFLTELAPRLGLSDEYILPAYEDPFHYLWQESRLPVDVDPLKHDLKDPLERKRLAKLLAGGGGLNDPAGFILPLRRDGEGWRSAPWPLRQDHLYLLPGDSPMGLRLPLDSLPEMTREECLEKEPPQTDPFSAADHPPLGDFHARATKRYETAHERATPSPTKPGKRSHYRVAVPRTALCAQSREGTLHLFLPPQSTLEAYLELVAAVEETAKALRLPLLLEGYEPPHDPRMNRFLVTPDPGVIEVNIHPSASWAELVERTTQLYEQARLSRLGTEKFMLDGRHTGTGGGNHVVLGGATPMDSPMLRRPDLLRSLITYWQRHPGLSYLFSTLFIGPTSQAPRVDEARDDALYELELAFRHMPTGEVPQPWLVDRLLRNLLVDLTGNTHRAEFCIDKLYSPDGPTGRLGLVELRAFEMPPHARMSLVQALLVRALLAWFWKSPLEGGLIHWGTELHDRFLLPHYVRSDVAEVAADLTRAGYPFSLEWLEPFLEFRFPHYGEVQLGDLRMELRMALEPWPVLGEEVASGGTARFVDSSLERLQIQMDGFHPERYLVACNGRRVPLRPTGINGRYVAGVRYRAWQPPSALHPTIGVHSPLLFDVIDTWSGRSIGGCAYHVSHAGGRSYEQFPVNAFEAEGRRVNRFQDHGFNPGPMELPPQFADLGRFLPRLHEA
ncbi:MAG: transglutaminase family protein, partial [Magnetococcales bacterium]|nr:transglutaminase family protein [Magnetococcales bacterium]